VTASVENARDRLLRIVRGEFGVRRGHPLPYGASARREGVNFSVYSRHASEMSLVLYVPGDAEPVLELPLDPRYNKTGDVWHVLMAKRADRRAEAEQVAFKLMVWSWKLNDEQRGGLSSRQFIRAHLIQLGLGDELTHILRGGVKRGLATIEEVLELRPELRGSPAEEVN